MNHRGSIRPSRRKPTRRRRTITWLVLAGLAVAVTVTGIVEIRKSLHSGRLQRCREAADPIEAKQLLDGFFATYRQALQDGALGLESESPEVLEGNLRMLQRILLDDELLESEVHRRFSPAKGQKAIFSAHEWLAEEKNGKFRSDLARLTCHGAEGIRSLAVSSLAILAEKIPEALAAEPLPPFRREHLRAALRLETGQAPPAALQMPGFFREILLRPASLRLWEKDGQPPEKAVVLALAFRGLLGMEEVLEGKIAAAAALAVEPGAVLPAAVRVLHARLLGRLDHPEAWPILVGYARGPDRALRQTALRALRSCGPPETIPLLREIQGLDREDAEFLRITLESIAGERVTDWKRWKPQPGRLPGLSGKDADGEEITRKVAALRFNRLRPEMARKDPAVRHAVMAALASPSPLARAEAARALGRMGAVEAIGPEAPPDPNAPRAPCLMDLLLDADFRVAAAAAAGLLEMTAFQSESEGGREGARSEDGSLPAGLAADPVNLVRWADSWNVWWSERQRETAMAGTPGYRVAPASWFLEGLRSDSTARMAAGAQGLRTLQLQGALGPAFWEESLPWLFEDPIRLPAEQREAGVKNILKQWGRLGAAAKAGVLEALAAGGGGPKAADALWRIYEPTFRSEGAEAWAILEAVGGILQRAAPEPKAPAVLDGLIRGLERIEGAPAALIAHYLDTRFGMEAVDERLFGAIRRLSPAGPEVLGNDEAALRDEARGRLARWFPRTFTKSKAAILVDLLEDPSEKVRFWALRHLAEAAGRDLGFDPAAPVGAERSEALKRWRNWAGN